MEYFQIRSGMVDSMGSKRQAGHLMALFTILVFLWNPFHDSAVVPF